MKKKWAYIILSFIILLVFLIGKQSAKRVDVTFSQIEKKLSKDFKDGDIIFQTSESSQSNAIKLATNSNITHCGILFKKDSLTYVVEAVQPVKITRLYEWIANGKNKKYAVKRLENLNKNQLQNMKNYGMKLIGKNYDLYFGWDDTKIYCSELVWKIYKKGANIELCKLKKLKEFNLSDKNVKKVLNERYGNEIPLNEKVVSPSQIYESSLLKTIYSNY